MKLRQIAPMTSSTSFFVTTIVTVLTTAALSLTSSALAAQYDDECFNDILIHQYDGGVKVAIEGQYMVADIANTDYALRHTIAPTQESFKTENVSATYDFAAMLDIAYLFPGTGNEISFRFTTLELKSDSTTRGSGVIANRANFLEVAEAPDYITVNPVEFAKGRSKFDMRHLELLFSQTVKTATERVKLRWIVGGRSSSIHVKSKALYATTANSDIGELLTADSEISAYGPMLGAGTTVQLWKNLSLNAEVISTALLPKKITARIENTITNAAILDTTSKPKPTFREGVTNYDYRRRVVPMLDLRAGLNYMMTLSNDTQLAFELGLQVSKIVDGDRRFSASGADIGLHGYYLRATYFM